MLGAIWKELSFLSLEKFCLLKAKKMNHEPKCAPHEDATALILLQITS